MIGSSQDPSRERRTDPQRKKDIGQSKNNECQLSIFDKYLLSGYDKAHGTGGKEPTC